MRSYRTSWHGIHRKQTEDSGYISSSINISVEAIPYLVPAPSPSNVKTGYANPISVHGFDDFLIVIYRDGTAVKADYITSSGTVYTGVIKASGATASDEYPRSVVQFNVYTTPDDPLSGTFDKKLIVFPDRLSMPFTVSANFTFANVNTEANPIPAIKYGVTHLSRLFGVDSGRIYASGFNDYSKWTLDTADESLSSNAWCSPAQANTKGDSDFTAITVYDGHVICFKKDFMQTIYNTKNPFRVVDIVSIGADNNQATAEVGGILFFASSERVYAYSGAYPSDISDRLDVSDFSGALLAGYDGELYVYCPSDDTVYTYGVSSGEWGSRSVGTLTGLCSNDNGVFGLTSGGAVVKLNTSTYGSWALETDLFMSQSTEKRRVKKLSMYVDIASGAFVKADVYDDHGLLHNVIDSSASSLTGKRVLRCAVRMTSAYGHKIRIYGSGKVMLKELELYVSSGGDVYVSE